MQSIFLGRVASAEYIPFANRGGVYAITYDVFEWFKGDGGPHTKIVWYPSIPCAEDCPVEETIRNFEASKATAVFFAASVSKIIKSATGEKTDWDGEIPPCWDLPPLQLTDEALPSRSELDYDYALFRNALRREIRALKKARRP